MCRYAFKDYKPHFACFGCRKTFKKVRMEEYFAQRGLGPTYDRLSSGKTDEKHAGEIEVMEQGYLKDVGICTHCGTEISSVGMDFRAPPMAEKEAWAILHCLYQYGFAFTGCGCSVGYKPPAKMSGMAEFLGSHSRKSGGKKLLENIQRKLAPQ